MKKFYTIFIFIVALAAGLAYLFQAGWYPLVLVNSELIWGRVYEKEYNSALKYYNEAITVYNFTDMGEDQLREIRKDIKRATLEKIIENTIIAANLKELFGKKSEGLVDAKIKGYLRDPKLKAAANSLFNLRFKDFKDLILVPQAKREIMKEQLSSESRDFNNWLNNQKIKANIYLFTGEYFWDGKKIKKR